MEGALPLQLMDHPEGEVKRDHRMKVSSEYASRSMGLPSSPRGGPLACASPGLLQQVGLDASTTDPVGLVEVDLNQLPKPTAVVVPERLGVAKGLENRVGLMGGVRQGRG